MTKNPATKPVDELAYEDALNELERIVAALEEQQYPLEESMALFERGQALVHRCETLLNQAEVKVKQLAGNTLIDLESEE